MHNNLRLGVNIDHVATIRNARGGSLPDPVRAAILAADAGADGITAHLREDRRHISDEDIARISKESKLPLNFEMAATQEMQQIALKWKPHAVCLVPEKREERTTEGGLDVAGNKNYLTKFIAPLRDQGSRISLFIEASKKQIDASIAVGAAVVEIHTGAYCDAHADHDFTARDAELSRIIKACKYASDAGLEVHAGHGLTFDTVGPIAEIPELIELNIGHFLIGEAIFCGLEASIKRMRALMDNARAAKLGSGAA